jgi:hypothetical protein
VSVLDPWLGRVLGGHYRIEQKLGSGDSTTTYLAEDLKLGRRVAL